MSYVQDSASVRTCDWPTCPRTYDFAAALFGEKSAPGWWRSSTFFLDLCPDHAGIWADGTHAVHLDHDTVTARCGCGWSAPGPTLGHMSDAYLKHLEEIANAD